MEKRIKILHVFTIIAIAFFCVAQCWWLYKRYNYTVNSYKDELYLRVSEIMYEELEMRRSSPNQKNLGIVTNSQIQANSGNPHNSITWTFDVYVAKGSEYIIRDSSDLKRIVKMYDKYKPDNINKHHFIVNNKKEDDVYKALDCFCIDEKYPFSAEELTKLLKKHSIQATDITTEQRDTMVWNPELVLHLNTLKPVIEITYPYDIFEGELVQMTFDIGISPIIKEMSGTLLLTLLLSIMLVSCLVAQIMTIRRQYKIEALRKDFIHTMVHELKRPISTLKMCVSFMRNDKLMQDRESREAVISDSYNELNNLSSYFSKLRDLTFDDVVEIPLNMTSFNLEGVIKECIAKLNIPGDKKVNIRIIAKHDISVTADRMHITNIISNLLENAIKYSNLKVDVEIEYKYDSDMISIKIKDNGIGIPKSDLKYIFDKFYRGHPTSDCCNPGLGLGLTYVKLLVSAHNGTICVNSKEGDGSVFIIKLPRNI